MTEKCSRGMRTQPRFSDFRGWGWSDGVSWRSARLSSALIPRYILLALTDYCPAEPLEAGTGRTLSPYSGAPHANGQFPSGRRGIGTGAKPFGPASAGRLPWISFLYVFFSFL